MQNLSTAEQITLDSGEINITPNESDLKKITMELLQTSKLQEKQRLVRVFDHDTLSVAEKTPGKTRMYLLKLALLYETPKRIYNINLKYLSAFIALEVITYVIYVLKDIGLSFMSSSYIYAIIALLIASSIIVLLMTIKSYNNKWVFYTARGHIPILEFYNNKPDRAKFQKFFGEFIDAIATAKAKNGFSSSKMLPAEVSEHRRLRDEGIITPEQYEKAKLRILNNK